MDSPEGIRVKMLTEKALLFSFSIENLSFFWNTKSSQRFDPTKCSIVENIAPKIMHCLWSK